jgi:hypothetical protein
VYASRQLEKEGPFFQQRYMDVRSTAARMRGKARARCREAYTPHRPPRATAPSGSYFLVSAEMNRLNHPATRTESFGFFKVAAAESAKSC